MEQVKELIGASSSWMSDFVPPRPVIAGSTWTAPAVPTSGSLTPAPAPGPSTPADPVAVLDDLVDGVDGVSGAILASVDGFGLARSTSMADEPSHAAMLAAAVGLARQLVSMGGGDRLRQLVVDHDAGLMLVWPIGSQRVLAVLASSLVDQRAVRSAVHAQVSTLSGVVA